MKPRKLLILLEKVNNERLVSGILATLIAGGTLTAVPAGAATYRWLDENGNVVYSQTPPPPGRTADVIKPPPPPADPDARQRLNEQLLRLEDAREDRQLSNEKTTEEQTRVAARERNCNALANNIDGIKNSPPRRLVKDPDGNYVRLTDEDRSARLAKLQARYDEECN